LRAERRPWKLLDMRDLETMDEDLDGVADRLNSAITTARVALSPG